MCNLSWMFTSPPFRRSEPRRVERAGGPRGGGRGGGGQGLERVRNILFPRNKFKSICSYVYIRYKTQQRFSVSQVYQSPYDSVEWLPITILIHPYFFYFTCGRRTVFLNSKYYFVSATTLTASLAWWPPATPPSSPRRRGTTSSRDQVGNQINTIRRMLCRKQKKILI